VARAARRRGCSVKDDRSVPREVLQTERLYLEPVSPAHADSLFQAVMDSRPELLPWMPWAREPTLEGTRMQAKRSGRAWHKDDEFHFCLVERQSRQVLGVVGLNRDGPASAELHYWIRSDHAHQGLATEACRALIDWAPTLGVKRLTLWAGRDNAASRRVAEKLGFVHIGPLDWRPDGGLGAFDAESYGLQLPAPRRG
jgi:ribosomal-protein-serine acetyltransferase